MAKVNDLVFCIFSFNRSAYLKNLINSIIVFYPDTQVVIFDDNSDEEELLRLYGKLVNNPAYTIVKPGIQHQTSIHGGLYDLMNMALQYCWEKNFIYAFFIQDDMQFIQHVDLDDLCEHNFVKWQNALMISPLFMQKIYLPKINSYVEKKNGDYIFKNYGIADAGIIHLNRAKAAVLEFSKQGEKYNGAKYFALGYNLVLSLNPCLAWVPWALSYKNNKKSGAFIYRKNTLFIKPVNDQKRKQLAGNKNLPFLEDFSMLSVWWIPKPYIYLAFNIKNIIVSYWNYWTFLIFRK